MIRLFFCLSLLLLCSPILADGVWKVTKGSQSFFLAGSIHMLGPADYPLPPEYLSALGQSKELILETDLDQLSSPEGMQQMLSLNSYPSGQNLLQQLSAELAQKLGDYCRENQLPLQQITRFKPAFAAMMLTTSQLKTIGATAPGVDAYLLEQAKQQGKKVSGFESTAEHLAVLTALNNSSAETLIKSTLDDLKQSNEDFAAMRMAWRSGNLAQLETLYLDDLKQYPDIYQTLIVNRNNQWLTQLHGKNSKEGIFILVGALHLTGEQGLLQQLKQQGYHISVFKDEL